VIVDDILLRAYVDGELEPRTSRQVEAAIANSPALTAQVQAMRASRLSYGAAFEAQALPEVPAELNRYVADLLSVADAAQAAATAAVAAQPAAAQTPHADRHATGRRAALFGVGWAAAFAAGVLWRGASTQESAHLSQLAGVNGNGSGNGNGKANANANANASAPWVDAIAQYHALYVRETLDQAADAPARLQTLLADFPQALQRGVQVPDLGAKGFTFKRVQRLGYEQKPLIQMVYLPAIGKPLALCFLPVGGADEPVRAIPAVAGLAAAFWQQGGLAFVIVGDFSPPQALELGQWVAHRVGPPAGLPKS
jgi:anti-sigma factor RsiW